MTTCFQVGIWPPQQVKPTAISSVDFLRGGFLNINSNGECLTESEAIAKVKEFSHKYPILTFCIIEG
ncbi:hypothetical protein GCM10027291_06420 [Telluribacter humicola]